MHLYVCTCIHVTCARMNTFAEACQCVCRSTILAASKTPLADLLSWRPWLRYFHCHNFQQQESFLQKILFYLSWFGNTSIYWSFECLLQPDVILQDMIKAVRPTLQTAHQYVSHPLLWFCVRQVRYITCKRVFALLWNTCTNLFPQKQKSDSHLSLGVAWV